MTGKSLTGWGATLEWLGLEHGSFTGNNMVWRKFTFSPITTTKIRVSTNAS